LFLANADQLTPRCRNAALRCLIPRRALSLMDGRVCCETSAHAIKG
jgi:hypothetical protein